MQQPRPFFFLGIKDDILILSASKKFIIQLLSAGIIIHFAGLRIQSMHGLFGLYALPEVVSIAVSYISIIVVINAFNLIDGVDGLAGSLGLLTMTLFGTYFYLNGQSAYALFAFAMAGSLIAFLIFNYNPARIFMGDSGSLLLGLVNAILVMKFIAVADNPATLYPLQSAVAIGFSILMVPLADTLRVFSIRIFKGRSPFVPDRNHIHHLLLDKGLSPKYVTLCCLLLNIMFITLAYFARSFGPSYVMLALTLAACTFLGLLISFKSPEPKLPLGRTMPKKKSETVLAATPKFVTRAKEAVLEN